MEMKTKLQKVLKLMQNNLFSSYNSMKLSQHEVETAKTSKVIQDKMNLRLI